MSNKICAVLFVACYCVVINAAPDIATLAYRDDLSDAERLHWQQHYKEQREELANNAIASLHGTRQLDNSWHTLRVAWDESVMRVITLSVGATLTAYPTANQNSVDFLMRESCYDVNLLFAAAPQQIRLDVNTAERWRGIPLDGGDATWTLVHLDNTKRELTVVAHIAYNCSDDIARGFDSHAIAWMAAPWITTEICNLQPHLLRCTVVAPATLEITAVFTLPANYISPKLCVVFPSVLRRSSRTLHSD